ncbi:DNA cytosine methyltransferase, partial [Aeromonas veronii]
HDDAAIAMHEANHRETIHLPHNVWKVSMCELIGDNYFGLLWLSPDCRDHSPAKGGPITSRSVRDLAWVLVRWLKELPDWQRPWVICLENVPAFSKWSPLIPLPDGKYERDKNREGEIFHRFVKAVAAFGYHIGWTEI